MKKLVLGVMIAAAVTGSNVFAMDGVSVEVSADFYSKYVWRGQNLVDDWVFQPGVSFTFGNFTAGIWGNADIRGDASDQAGVSNESFEFTEWDYSLDYSADVPGIEGLGFSVGIINYHLPSYVPDTTEVYWGLSLDVPLSPSVTVYHDIDEADGMYISAGIGHSIENIASLGSDTPVGLDIGVSVGWGDKDYNTYYWGAPADSSGLNDLAITVAFPMEIGGWSVSPSLNYVSLLNSDIRRTDTYQPDSDYFFTGISLSTSF